MDANINVRQKIMEVGLALFSEQGYEGVSVNDLAQASGITKPTLYYYFGNKEGVFEAISKANYDRLNAVVSESAVYRPNPHAYYEDIFSALEKVARAYFSFAKGNEAFYRMALANLFMPRSSDVWKIVSEQSKAQYETVEQMFCLMADAHGNLKGKSRILAWSFIGLINAYIGLYYNGVPDVDLGAENVKELVRQFMHGIYS